MQEVHVWVETPQLKVNHHAILLYFATMVQKKLRDLNMLASDGILHMSGIASNPKTKAAAARSRTDTCMI